MPSFDTFMDTVRAELKTLAEQSLQAFKTAAIEDGEAFVSQSEADLRRWTEALAAGELGEDDLRFLIAGKKDVAELSALKQAGLAKVARDKFVNDAIDLITKSALKAFG